MLYDPETTLTTLRNEEMNGLKEFTKIYNAIPIMLSGLTIHGYRGCELAEIKAK